MNETISRTQALTQALILGLTAETEDRSDLAIVLAAMIAQGMTEEQVAAAKSAAAQIAEGLQTVPMKQKPAKTLFAVFLMEDENGIVTVRTEYIGQGEQSFHLGMEILEGLMILETMSDTLYVEPCTMSSYRQ